MSASFVSRWGRYTVAWARKASPTTTAQTDAVNREELVKHSSAAAALPEKDVVVLPGEAMAASSGAVAEAAVLSSDDAPGVPPRAAEATARAEADLLAWLEPDEMESPGGGLEVHRLPGRGY